MNIDMIILILGIIGTIAFAISGALIAIENQLDLFGVIIIGFFTACGGGLIRDIMLNSDIAIFSEYWNVIIAVGVSLIIFIIMYYLRNLKWQDSNIYKVAYNIIDSIGLGTFVVVGANVAIKNGKTDIFPVCFYAVMTGVGGGILRDILVNKIPSIFRKHIYAIATIVGALLYYLFHYLNWPYILSAALTVGAVVILRVLAYHFRWNLPKVKLSE